MPHKILKPLVLKNRVVTQLVGKPRDVVSMYLDFVESVSFWSLLLLFDADLLNIFKRVDLLKLSVL